LRRGGSKVLYILAAFGISLSIVFYQLFKGIFSKNNFINRVANYTGNNGISIGEKSKKQDRIFSLNLLAKGFEKASILKNYKDKLRKKLIKANFLMRPEEFMSVYLVAFIAGAVFGAILFRTPVMIIILACICSRIPSIILKRNINKRLKTINHQLGDTIAIMSNAMKAGHSFFQAIDSVTREMTDPIAEEFSRLQKEISLGVGTETALENMVERVGSDDLELVVTAVLIQRQIGGNLAEILDNISDTIRQRIRAKGEIKTITAQGRMSGVIISILPFGLAAVISIINPQQMITLISHPLGLVMIGIALVMEIIGIILVRKIVNVEV
jgi:tight adherence protein B